MSKLPGKYIYYVGEGTQQIEEQLKKLFPDASYRPHRSRYRIAPRDL